jgi:LSD1 subclass zinc finger protein
MKGITLKPIDCKGCGVPIPVPRGTSQVRCEGCNSSLWSNRTKEQIVRYRATTRAWNKNRRLRVLAAYGSTCQCCGEAAYEFLVIDHVDGGGSRHRKNLPARGTAIYKWLEDNGFPEGFRVLCHNCNSAIGLYGYCPHQRQQ